MVQNLKLCYIALVRTNDGTLCVRCFSLPGTLSLEVPTEGENCPGVGVEE